MKGEIEWHVSQRRDAEYTAREALAEMELLNTEAEAREKEITRQHELILALKAALCLVSIFAGGVLLAGVVVLLSD